MKDYTPKYNFISYESLVTDTTTLPNQPMITETSYNPLITDVFRRNKLTKSINSNSKISIKSSTNTLYSLYNASFNKTTKDFEEKIKVIKHANSLNSNVFSTHHLEKKTLENSVKKLSTFLSMNRIETSSRSKLFKGYMKEQSLLQYKSNIIKQDTYYLKNKILFLQDEVNSMQKAIQSNKTETRIFNNKILEIQKDIMILNDDIKQLNKLNSDSLASKDSINNTLDMLKKHNSRLIEMIKNQDNKTSELVHSVNALAKNMTRHIQGIVSNRKVHDSVLY